MSLMEAAALLGPDSPVTVATLRSAVRRGELATISLVGKILTIRAALREALTQKRLDQPTTTKDATTTVTSKETRIQAAVAAARASARM